MEKLFNEEFDKISLCKHNNLNIYFFLILIYVDIFEE